MIKPHLVRKLSDIPTLSGAPHPVPAVDKCKARRKQRLSAEFGIDQFGVNRVELDPGVWSTVRHWHSHEDEFVMVLEGELTLVTDTGEQVLTSGDVTGFKSGVADGHRLENRSQVLAVYLEVGSSRRDVDTVTYSDDDLLVRHDDSGRQVFVRKDGTFVAMAE